MNALNIIKMKFGLLDKDNLLELTSDLRLIDGLFGFKASFRNGLVGVEGDLALMVNERRGDAWESVGGLASWHFMGMTIVPQGDYYPLLRFFVHHNTFFNRPFSVIKDFPINDNHLQLLTLIPYDDLEKENEFWPVLRNILDEIFGYRDISAIINEVKTK